MFQPDQAALLAWTSDSMLGHVLRHPDIPHSGQAETRGNARDGTRIRTLGLTAGLAILLFVLALVILATSPAATAHAAVAAPPVFCSNPALVFPVSEAEIPVLPEFNRSRLMCSQMHLWREPQWPMRCWVSLGVSYNLPHPRPPINLLSYCAVLP